MLSFKNDMIFSSFGILMSDTCFEKACDDNTLIKKSVCSFDE